tara:strand:- start:41 stop:313 length:273 start_codon:yes stop_codon:yes gene_type:complete
MNFIVVLIAIGVAVFYANQQIKTIEEPLLLLYVTWVTVLIALNILISIYIYLFSHSIKESPGNKGIRGAIGIRGEEGKSAYCPFPKRYIN